MRKNILIVDDDPDICNSLAILFREEGYYVDETTDSKEAAILIKQDRHDVYLFDYTMKGASGKDLLKMAKDVNPRCLVFIISGRVDIDKLCHKLADGIIIKPFDVEALLQRIAG